MSPLERRTRALLRWYPRAWRHRHGEVVLATLLDDADARGLRRPTRADAWSIRTQGLAERATPRAAAVVAAAGVLLTAALLALSRLVWMRSTAPVGDTSMQVVSIVGNMVVATPLVALAALMLAAWRRASPWSLLGASAAVIAASVVLGCAALWSVAHPIVVSESDGGTSIVSGMPSVAASVAATAIVAIGLVPLVRAWVPLREQHPVGWPVAVVGALGVALAGIGLAQTSLLPFVGIAIVLLVATRGMRRTSALEAGSAHAASRVRSSWPPRVVGLLAIVTIVVALPTSILAILASIDAVSVADAGMRLVGAIAVASVLAVVVALALVLRARLGAVVWAPAAAFALATVAAAAATAMDVGRPGYGPTVVVAAAFAGLGIALVVLLATPGGAVVRAIAGLVVGTNAAALLAQLLPYAAAAAWVLAVPLVVLAVRRIRGGADAAPAAATP